jgi:5'-nucleotidase
VNLALLHILRDHPPDLVVSGINFGPNMGDDVTYSGTISAAFEGSLLGVPSIAFSALVGERFSFDPCAEFAARFVAEALETHHNPRIIMNVNFPVAPFTGVRVTTLGRRFYTAGAIERLDPRGRKYYWIGGEPPVWEPTPGTDIEAVRAGKVSVTPLHLDMTHHESIAALRPLEEKLGHGFGES